MYMHCIFFICSTKWNWIPKLTRINCFRYLKLMSPLNAAICTTTYLERQKCYGPGKKILFKKQLFDLEVKGQGPTKVITVCDTPPYGHAPTYQINTIYKTIIWPWGQRSRSHEGHYGMWHTALWSCTHIPNIIDLSRKTKMLWPGQENTI